MLVWNFFSTSPLSQRWRLLYGLMKEMELLSAQQQESIAYTRFDMQQHYLLCSGAYLLGENFCPSSPQSVSPLFLLGVDCLVRLGGRPLGFPGMPPEVLQAT